MKRKPSFMFHRSPELVCSFTVALAAQVLQDVFARKHFIQFWITLLPNEFGGHLAKLGKFDFPAIVQAEIGHAGIYRNQPCRFGAGPFVQLDNRVFPVVSLDQRKLSIRPPAQI